MRIFSSLNREQQEAIGLLQIGTFLEYFDLMLYVHMAVLLNELFFPKTDPHTAALLTAFAFCCTYVLRPFGALLFGYLGDNMGRKTTVIITTMMMAVSCIVMANLPTYAQIGIGATWVVTVCRIVQGLSSMGEIIGAQIYVSEITKPPSGYVYVSFVSLASAVGGMAALGVATLSTRHGFDWRIAFWIGAGIAMIGSVARTRLRETPEFLEMKNKIKVAKKNRVKVHHDKIYYPTLIAYFLIQCGWPLSFFLGFFYFNSTLKQVFGYSAEDIILHNFCLTAVPVFQGIALAIMSYYINPLTILRIKGYLFTVLMIFIAALINTCTSANHIFVLQALILVLCLNDFPAQYIFIKQMPVHRRFTASGFIYASSRALTYIITSFGIVYLTEIFGHWGLLFITIPLCTSYLLSINYFEKLENQKHHQVHTPHPFSANPDEIKLAR